MNRRDALARVALLMGGTVIGADYFLTGCSSPTQEKQAQTGAAGASKKDFLSASQIGLLDEVGETILPTTAGSPGAKAARVGSFMAVMVRDCLKPEEQKIFLDGLTQLDERCQKETGKAFLAATPAERTVFITKLDNELKTSTPTRLPNAPIPYFEMMKQFTLLGYFTSEIGATKALRYLPVPGHYDGNYAYKKGDKAWATS